MAGESPQRRIRRDLRLLAIFVRIYCERVHRERAKVAVTLRGVDVVAICGSIQLCPDCRKLLQHALVKRLACPLTPKPACKRCPAHCYAPNYRAQIRAVMRYSGRRLVLSGRLDYLWHLWF